MNKRFLSAYDSLRKHRKGLLVPNYAQILTPNFSYMDYLKDAILFTKGVFEGYFEGYDKVDVSDLLSDGTSLPSSPKKMIEFDYISCDKVLESIAKKHYDQIRLVEDEKAFDEEISLAMVEAVKNAFDAAEISYDIFRDISLERDRKTKK